MISWKNSIFKERLREGFTHGGMFHADDVFATALLQILSPDIRIVRGFVVPEGFQGIVYDIGGGQYDHHQKDRRVRENGVPYAAFGLLWEQFGGMLLSEEDSQIFDAEFVQMIDLTDNTGEKNELSRIISDYLPTWQEAEKQMDDCFLEAAGFAKRILERRFRQIRTAREAYDNVYRQADLCGEGILFLERFMPWKDALQIHPKEILYVIYPSVRGGYNVQAVPDRVDKNALRHPFPLSWRGQTAAKLAEMTGIKDLEFCHMSGFLCAAQSIEGAYSAARLAMRISFEGTHNRT